MLIEDNEGGGSSVFVFAGDGLGEVPESHRGLITPGLRKAFVDPPAYFRRIAETCPFPNMAAWLRALLGEGAWALGLHRSFRPEWSAAGYCWWSDHVRSAEIAPPGGRTPRGLPAALKGYYSLVDRVSWMPFGGGGGLSGRAGHDPLAAFDPMYHGRGAGLDPKKTFVFGGSSGGDMLIYTKDGRGGWLCHENGKIHILGTIEEAIDWVYAELLADRSPDFDYGWLTPKA